jgi:hypothetical protein
MVRRPLLALLLLLLPASAHAQDAERPNPLLTLKAARCTFLTAAAGSWRDGKPSGIVRDQDLVLTVRNIDLADGTAEITGPPGRAFATVTQADGSLFLIDSIRGTLNVLGIFATPAPPGTTTLKAVYTRQSYTYLTIPPYAPEPSASQSYGECIPLAR